MRRENMMRKKSVFFYVVWYKKNICGREEKD